jgi:hypothetical protein
MKKALSLRMMATVVVAVMMVLNISMISNALNPSQGQSESITFSANEVTVSVGGKQTIGVKLPSDETRSITWSSSDEKIATIDRSGSVKGVAAGSVIITAKIDGAGLEAMCIVNVVDKTSSSAVLSYNMLPSTGLVRFPYSQLSQNKVINIYHSDVVISGLGKAWMGAAKDSGGSPYEMSVFVNIKKHPSLGIQSYVIGARQDATYFEQLKDFVSISIRYDENQFQDPTKLAVFSYNQKKEKWNKVDSEVDTLKKRVTAQVDRLGEYTVMEYTPSSEVFIKKLGIYTYITLAFIGGIALRHFGAIIFRKLTKRNLEF